MRSGGWKRDERLKRLVLFDIDGTLLLTAGAGRRAIVAALGEEVPETSAFADIRSASNGAANSLPPLTYSRCPLAEYRPKRPPR